jgi:phospholipid/cholesterol/gamma-HCH transport system permease protein
MSTTGSASAGASSLGGLWKEAQEKSATQGAQDRSIGRWYEGPAGRSSRPPGAIELAPLCRRNPLCYRPRVASVARLFQGVVFRVGDPVVALAQDAGGMVLLLGRILRALVPPTLDRDETWRNLYKMGFKSLPIVMLTAFFTGALMVVQTGFYVRQYGAYDMVGWGAGFAVLREVGPILIGLMFSGRVGSNNTAELATMVVTEQVDALRALAIEPIRFLVVPRFLSMVLMLFLLTVFGDALALFGGALMATGLIDIDFPTFFNSLTASIGLGDLFHGLYKSIAFGAAIGLVSCYFGLNVTGGARGVGRAVNASVVASAVGIFALDYLLTWWLG